MLKRLQSWLGLIPYISELDLFLGKLNHPKRLLTKAEQNEVSKHAVVANARDEAVPQTPPSKLWADF